MKSLGPAVLAAFVAICTARMLFERADFYVTEALLKQGVNLPALPELPSLSERPSDLVCFVVVSLRQNPIFALT